MGCVVRGAKCVGNGQGAGLKSGATVPVAMPAGERGRSALSIPTPNHPVHPVHHVDPHYRP